MIIFSLFFWQMRWLNLELYVSTRKIQNPLKFLCVCVCFESLSWMFLAVIPVCSSATALEDCRSFLQHHSLLLSSWPNIFIQQALNQPADSAASTWAQALVTKGGAHVMKCLNNTRQDGQLARWAGMPYLINRFIHIPVILNTTLLVYKREWWLFYKTATWYFCITGICCL